MSLRIKGENPGGPKRAGATRTGIRARAAHGAAKQDGRNGGHTTHTHEYDPHGGKADAAPFRAQIWGTVTKEP